MSLIRHAQEMEEKWFGGMELGARIRELAAKAKHLDSIGHHARARGVRDHMAKLVAMQAQQVMRDLKLEE